MGRSFCRRILSIAVLLIIILAAVPAYPGGGPRNVLIVVNENEEESLEIGTYYLRARDIPIENFCRIQTSSNLTVDKATYQNEIETPVETCINNSLYSGRIDYIVLTRGLPIRASFPGGNVSLTALLQVFDVPTLRGRDQEYNPATFTRWPNPYVNADEYFSHSKAFNGMNLFIGTMLSGYWSEDGIRLVDRSLASDLNPPTSGGGVFYLEDARPGAADFPLAVSNLQGAGFNAEHIVDPADVPAGSTVASHVNAGSYSGISKSEIESHTYPAGCIVDALESFGLVPANFTPGANPSQTPVTWWVT
ncbi:TIGR03790 family protein, partial [Acidobacteriota bacterium]